MTKKAVALTVSLIANVLYSFTMARAVFYLHWWEHLILLVAPMIWIIAMAAFWGWRFERD